MVEGHCFQVMKIVHYYANGCFDWLISEQQSDNSLREAISILSGKYKGFTFVHPVYTHREQYIAGSPFSFVFPGDWQDAK